MILQNQSLLDISIQEFGNVEALFELASLNNIGITDALTPAAKLKVPSIESLTPDVQRYYKNKDMHPATALTAIEYALTLFAPGLFEPGLFD